MLRHVSAQACSATRQLPEMEMRQNPLRSPFQRMNIRIAILPLERRHRLHLNPEMVDQDRIETRVALMS